MLQDAKTKAEKKLSNLEKAIEILKKNSQLNFQLIKEDNENLLKQINLLNDNFMQIDHKKKE